MHSSIYLRTGDRPTKFEYLAHMSRNSFIWSIPASSIDPINKTVCPWKTIYREPLNHRQILADRFRGPCTRDESQGKDAAKEKHALIWTNKEKTSDLIYFRYRHQVHVHVSTFLCLQVYFRCSRF